MSQRRSRLSRHGHRFETYTDEVEVLIDQTGGQFGRIIKMSAPRRSRIAELASEITTKGYFGRAQQRAKRRKSAWNLLDLPIGFSCITFIGWALLHALWLVRNSLVPERGMPLAVMFHSERNPVAHIVVLVGVLFAAMPIGMFISNVIVCSIPPYRRAIEPEAKGVWHASFSDAQKDLSLLALVVGAPSLIASLLAALTIQA